MVLIVVFYFYLLISPELGVLVREVALEVDLWLNPPHRCLSENDTRVQLVMYAFFKERLLPRHVPVRED